MHVVNYSDEDVSDGETFINSDVSQRFTDYLSGNIIHSKRCFILDMQDENLGLPRDIGKLFKAIKWTKFFQQPQPYNTQIVKELYVNLVDTINKNDEVAMRGVKVSYSKGIVNMMFKLGDVEDIYQNLLVNFDDGDYDVYIKSLCNPNTESVETGGEKTVKRMDLR